jgi:ribosome-binding factor A
MSKRSEKVAEAVHEIVSGLLVKGLKDPRIGFVTITGVKMTDDLSVAKVYFSVIGSDEEKKISQAGLQSAVGFIRKEVGKHLRLRHVPEIHFRVDESLERANTIERLLKQIHDEHPDDSSTT